MKKLISALFLVFITLSIRAQSTLHMSTSYKQICYWNPSASLFDKCGTNDEYPSLFTLNGDETMFTHTTKDIKSSYYISKRDYISSCSCYSYAVTSDVGNKYTFIVDLEKDAVKILSSGHKDENDDYDIIFTIKSHWKE